ncbi:MAG: hypothetical protein IPL61_38570 [Myxococcales bacterium]|nr:hypothetical protein [Myxococcales bacterium]
MLLIEDGQLIGVALRRTLVRLGGYEVELVETSRTRAPRSRRGPSRSRSCAI